MNTHVASAGVACPHRPPCPGCPRLGEPPEHLPSVGALREMAHRAAARFEVVAPPRGADHPLGYRHRARLAVRGRAGSPKVGIFQMGSHRIADIPTCLVHHPQINRLQSLLKQGIRATGVPPYADGPHLGLVRYVQAMVEPGAGKLQVVVVTNGTSPEPARPLLEWLEAALGADLDGLFWNGQPERSNRILGTHWHKVSGNDAMATRIGPVQVFFPPDAFSQNNPEVYAQILARVGQWVPDAARVVELYAGVGSLGLSVLDRSRSVAFNEVAEGSLRGLSLGLAALPATLAERARVLTGRAGEHAGAVAGCDVVIVDPPRRGLDAGLCERLTAPDGPGRLIYVSCGPKAFLAEAERLIAGGLSLQELVVFDLFPWTGHVETAALFSR